jgi:hypothetical protein
MLPVDALAIDVLCVNCYECIRYDLVDQHSANCLQKEKLEETKASTMKFDK